MTADLEDWQKARLAYTDAELYRLIIARLMVDGQAENKADADAWARSLGDIDQADKIIAFKGNRPGCVAIELDPGLFTCACGVSWASDGPPPPACMKERLG